MGNNDTQVYISVGFDMEILETVLDVFSLMVEYRNEIDFDRMDLEPFEKFEALVEKMESFRNGRESLAIIPMTRDEWFTYTPYVKHANDLVLNDHEGGVMADLSIKYSRANIERELPSGPV